MKHYQIHKWFALAVLLVVSQLAFSQQKWPDGSTHYPDGTVVYPNGQVVRPNNGQTTSYPNTGIFSPGSNNRHHKGKVVYNDGTVRYPNGTIRYPDGRVVRADGTVIYPNDRRWDDDRYDDRYEHRRNLPPGQAKKLYGAKSARDFAPGHNKHKGKHHGRD